jgi:hypothetical protein
VARERRCLSRKFDPVGCAVRENQTIIPCDVCDHLPSSYWGFQTCISLILLNDVALMATTRARTHGLIWRIANSVGVSLIEAHVRFVAVVVDWET